MLAIIIGNLCSLGAMFCDSASSTRKTKEDVLWVQCLSQFFYVGSALVLKGYSAVAQNAVAIFRNLASIKHVNSKALEIFLIILPVILGLYFNNRGIIGLLPVVANLFYSVVIFSKSTEKGLKIAFFFNTLMFMVFNFAIFNFVGGVSSIIVAATYIVSFLRDKKVNIGN